MAMYRLRYTKPAAVWHEAFLMGNGSLGAAVYGGIEHEQIKLNLDTLWSGSVRKETEWVDENVLQQARRLLFKGEYAKAHKLLYEKMPTDDSATYLPMGTVNIQFDRTQEAEGYLRELDISNATVYIKSFQRHECEEPSYIKRKYWVSYPNQAMICEFETNDPIGLSMSISVDSELCCSVDSGDGIKVSGKAPNEVCTLSKAFAELGEKIYSYENDDNTVRYCFVVKGFHKGGISYYQNDKLCLRSVKKAVLIITAETNFVAYDKMPDKDKKLERICRDRIDKITEQGIDEVYEAHLKDYKRLFDRVEIKLCGEDKNDIPTDIRIKQFQAEPEKDLRLIETLFQFGRYLLICSSRKGTQPANLQGIWSANLCPAWRCNYTTNINTEMNYWPAEICALAECGEPLIRMIEELSRAGTDTAEKLYGCRGFAVNHNTDLWRKTTPAKGDPSWSFWPMAGGWLCAYLWEHYRYCKDKQFLKETAMPITNMCARFLLDYLIEDRDGFYVTAPSTSPENVFISNGEKASVCIGSTMDMSIIREVFQNLISMCEILEYESEVAIEARNILEKLRPFKIDDERILEWNENFEEAEPGHRHLSHLYGIFPGNVIASDNKFLYDACYRALEDRLEKGSGHTGWSGAWILNLYTSFGRGEKAWECLKNFFANSIYPSMLDKHPPFQIDGNLGITAGIARMLVEERNGQVILLNAVPEAWKSGEVKGLRLPGKRSISFKWENGVVVEQKIVEVNE